MKSGVHKVTPRENRERPESGMNLNSLKKTQYLMNTLYINVSALSYLSFSYGSLLKPKINIFFLNFFLNMNAVLYNLKVEIPR